MDISIPKHYDDDTLKGIISRKAFPYITIADLSKAVEEDGASFEEIEIIEVCFYIYIPYIIYIIFISNFDSSYILNTYFEFGMFSYILHY